MPIKVYITNDFNHLSAIACDIVKREIINILKNKKHAVLGLATGNSPTGLYKHLAKAANENEFDSRKIKSFNLDEYIGLPGENAQLRALHPESYSFFMIQEFFSLLKNKFIETNVPFGCLVDQKKLEDELAKNKDDWKYEGTDAGKSIFIKQNAKSEYLKWVKNEVLESYADKIKKFGGIDLQLIGVGGKGHVAFHESGIPFEGSNVLLVKLDDNTIENAVKDGHFEKKENSPRFAVSMGAELVYKAKTVVLLANGQRKTESATKSLLEAPSPSIPISYGQIYSKNGGNLIYVLDKIAGSGLFANKDKLKEKGIDLEQIN